MNTQDLLRLGVPAGEPVRLALEFIRDFITQGGLGTQLENEVARIIADPSAFFSARCAPLARVLYRLAFTQRKKPRLVAAAGRGLGSRPGGRRIERDHYVTSGAG